MRNPKNAMRWPVLALAASTSLAACARHGGPTPPPGTYQATLQRIDGPYVLAGAEFEAQLVGPIGTDISRPGDVFVARVTTPLKNPRGHEVVPAGSRLTGRVVEVTHGLHAALALKFDTIETTRGKADVHAALESAGYQADVALAPPPPREQGVPTALPEPWAFDSLLRPPGAPVIGAVPPEAPPSIGGGPPPTPLELGRVAIPESTVVRLVLLDRVIAPGVVVETPPREDIWPYGRGWIPPVHNYTP